MQKDKEHNNLIQRRFQRKRKIEAILHYGGKCECCGEKRIEFLCIDHINGGGTKHHKEIKSQIHNWLKRNGWPKGYRVLCYNCNAAREYYPSCPHQNNGKSVVTNNFLKNLGIKVDQIKTPPILGGEGN